jgi:Tetratricopeptide repeat
VYNLYIESEQVRFYPYNTKSVFHHKNLSTYTHPYILPYILFLKNMIGLNNKINMLLKTFSIIFFLMIGVSTFAQTQEIELAETYFKLGEYEKAKLTFQKLLKNKDNVEKIQDKYKATLLKLKNYEDLEKFIKRQIKDNSELYILKAELANVFELQNKTEEAKKKYDELFKQVKTSEEKVKVVTAYFMKKQSLEMVITLLNEARKEANSESLYAIELARVYQQMGNKEGLIEEILKFGLYEGGQDAVKAMVQDYLKEEKDNNQFEKALYKKVQAQPNEPYYIDLLIWNLVQKKEFNRAFIQARAIDRKLKGGGQKVFELAGIAYTAKEFKETAPMYDYITKEYPDGDLYIYARRLLINCREEIIKNTFPVAETDIRGLIADYQRLFQDVGRTPKTMEALRNTAKLYGFYLDRKDSAQIILESAIKLAGADKDFKDRCKLDLGDNYLLQNDQWEATLIYSQVEKSQKEEQLGHEAKLRNARLNYYTGNFTLAKDILDVLKQATTREISNDALSLSLLIQDNTGLDTSTAAMEEYAAIDLLVFQNQNEKALKALDEMLKKYPAHSLADDILLLRATIHQKVNQPEKALADYMLITENYKYEITADDAIYNIAKLYDEKLKDPSKAMDYYQRILVEFPGSIYGADARKKYRKLRGDAIN